MTTQPANKTTDQDLDLHCQICAADDYRACGCDGWYPGCPGCPDCLAEETDEQAGRAACQQAGRHLWSNDAQIGPESGSETLDCTRCDAQQTVGYY